MRTALASVAALAILAAVLVTARTVSPSPKPGPRTVVVAELFTSEGCSSCPPADTLLREWVAGQPVDGVEILALGQHVDYWDRLGWRDPYSSAEFSQRQSAYDDAVFRSGRIYTPQLVVDGRLECIGSDGPAVRRALVEAARQAKANVSVSAATAASGGLDVRVQVRVPPGVTRDGPADVMLAVTEDDLATRVQRGENGGRTLRHTAVTRTLTAAGSIDADAGDASIAAVVPVSSDWASANLRVVAFVQERGSRRILGGGATPRGAVGGSR